MKREKPHGLQEPDLVSIRRVKMVKECRYSLTWVEDYALNCDLTLPLGWGVVARRFYVLFFWLQGSPPPWISFSQHYKNERETEKNGPLDNNKKKRGLVFAFTHRGVGVVVTGEASQKFKGNGSVCGGTLFSFY